VSRASSLAELALELARKHERPPTGHIAVVPVIVDDLTFALPLLKGLCEIHEGRFLETSDAQFGQPILGTDDVLRRAAVVQEITGQPLTDRGIQIVDKGQGLVDVALVNPSTTSPSLGEHAVLAVARAILHRDLDDRAFAIISYRESAIDFPFRRSIWKLAVDQLQGMRHSTLRTLVLVIEGPIRIDDHCQPGKGFQLALVQHRLLKRNSEDDLAVRVRAILNQNGPLVLFLGAGFSASSNLPDGNTMRDSAIRHWLHLPEEMESAALAERFCGWLTSDHPTWRSPTEVAMTPEAFAKGLTLEQVISVEQRLDASLPTLQSFRTRHDQAVEAPGSSVNNLSQVLTLLGERRVVVIEVNFDLLIEKHISSELEIFATQEQFEKAPAYLTNYLSGQESKIPLLKLHGTIEEPESCVIRTEQTNLGLGENKVAALRLLQNGRQPISWVYIGASLRDLDLRPLLSGADFASGTNEVWVSPYLPESIEQFAHSREHHWRGTGLPTLSDRLITETSDAFFRALREACESVR